MKTINETFTDEEHEKLKIFKKKMSWHDFIMFMYQHCKESQKKGDFEIY